MMRTATFFAAFLMALSTAALSSASVAADADATALLYWKIPFGLGVGAEAAEPVLGFRVNSPLEETLDYRDRRSLVPVLDLQFDDLRLRSLRFAGFEALDAFDSASEPGFQRD